MHLDLKFLIAQVHLLEWFLEVKEWQVVAVLNHEAEHLKAPACT